MTKDWPVYHVFLAQLDGRTYRCSPALDDVAFDRLMDALRWRMPYHLPGVSYRRSHVDRREPGTKSGSCAPGRC